MKINRREFTAGVGIGTAAVAAGLSGCAFSPKYYAGPIRPEGAIRKGKIVSGRPVNLAFVGSAGKGGSNIDLLQKAAKPGEIRIVGLCDADFGYAERVFKQHPDVPKYWDYRKMYAELDDQIDAVVVSTPDHMHFPAALAAIQAGKHVYVEKPLTHTIRESRILREAVKIHEVKSQMGNQGNSSEGARLLREWVEAGIIGDVYHVDIWTNRPAAGRWVQNCTVPTEKMEVPNTLNWNLWQGIARERAYNKCYVPRLWRGWWEYGCGAIGDMGCHTMNASFFALDLATPYRVELLDADGGNAESPPNGTVVKYHFGRRGDLAPCTMCWYEGSRSPKRPKELEPNREFATSGQVLYGTKGVLYLPGDNGHTVRLIPEKAMEGFKAPRKVYPRIKGGHHRNFLDAVLGLTDQACSNFDYAAQLSELGALGNLAIRSGKSFDWNSELMLASAPEAQKFIDKQYRRF